MADQNTTEVSEPTTSVKPEPAKTTEKKAPAAKKPAAKASTASATKAAPKRKQRRYTPEERASLLAAVTRETVEEKKTLKDTLLKLNLSEQTYYNWRNDQAKAKPAAAKAATKSAPTKQSTAKASPAKAPAAKAATSKAPTSKAPGAKISAAKTAPAGDDLRALVSLEAENQRLRKSLADKLRKENAELRKRLGLS